MRRMLLAIPFAALAGVTASALPGTAAAATGAGCRTAEVQVHDEAVFGHFATLATAKALAAHAASAGFKGIKIENDGCGDFEVEIDGADRQADRTSFAKEAQKAGFEVTFEQTGPPLKTPPGQTYGVFGTFTSIPAANKLSLRIAGAGFRYVDIAYANRKWLVVMPQVPLKAALSIAKEANKAGFHIAFQS